MRTLRVLIFILLFFTLSSCEGALYLQGHVYDNTSKRVIAGVQIILVLENDDTIWKCKPPFPYELDRDKYELAFTDISGHFSISSGLISMGPGELKSKIVFIKNGYVPAIIAYGEGSKFDSVQMQLLQ